MSLFNWFDDAPKILPYPACKGNVDEPLMVRVPIGESIGEFGERWNNAQQRLASEFHRAIVNDEFDKLRRAKALVFMRLNAARDAKDKKTIATLTEIQEAMR